MDEFSGILFHVNAGNPDAQGSAADVDVKITVGGDGQFILGDLVAFGQVRVKVVFAREPAFRLNGAMGCQGHFDGVVHHLFIEHRQYAGHSQAHRTGVGVRGGTEGG